jgi:CRP/FNR family transcriptional regulator, dissimilatory nitrate respiration regulator
MSALDLYQVPAMNIVDILDACELFAEVPKASFQRLATMARLCQFRKGQAIFRENEPCPGVYIVGQGLVRVFKRGPGGREHVLHIVGAGSTFAEVAAIGNFNVPASAEAVSKTTCVLLPQDRFRAALAEDHGLCQGMLAGMTLWVRRLVTLIEDITLRDAAGRIARYLLDLSESKRAADGSIGLPSLKRYVASHLNLTSETFSRTLRRLIEAGLVAEAGPTRVRVLQPKKLRQVAEGLFPTL